MGSLNRHRPYLRHHTMATNSIYLDIYYSRDISPVKCLLQTERERDIMGQQK